MIRQAAIRSLVLVLGLGAWTAASQAAVTYQFNGSCINDCGPVGVIDADLSQTAITGHLDLDIPAQPQTQLWGLANVLDYSFSFGGFTLDSGNSSLSESVVGDIPFTGTALVPFSPADGWLIARYDLNSQIFLVIKDFLNLRQPNEPICGNDDCQTMAIGSWVRSDDSLPLPSGLLLLSLGMLALGARCHPRRRLFG